MKKQDILYEIRITPNAKAVFIAEYKQHWDTLPFGEMSNANFSRVVRNAIIAACPHLETKLPEKLLFGTANAVTSKLLP